jgi:hypothetical protein
MNNFLFECWFFMFNFEAQAYRRILINSAKYLSFEQNAQTANLLINNSGLKTGE